MDIGAWLRGLGLARYEPAFRENAIDASVLPNLTADDLKDLGVVLVGHRRRLLDAIASLSREPTAIAAARVTPERRQLSVMFCDLVGSTPLSARLDPEDLRGIIGSYHRCLAETVESFRGFVARYMGDGALIYFGYPQAHEDDAERAIRCALALIDRVSQLNLAEKLQSRVGIATGVVVVGGEVVEHDVVGETPNLSARLQALAEPDTVVIAASTRRLVGDLFEYRDLGAVEVKGIVGPVPAWRVLRLSTVASRFEALRGATLSPLIGRDDEIELLLRLWERAKAGHGQVVLVSGEPGIGKSRLTAALAERLGAEPYVRLRNFCSPYHQESALFPFIDRIGRAAGFAHDDPPATKLEKLQALLALATPPDEDLALLADLMSLPVSERGPLSNLSPQRKKDRTLEALIRQLQSLARQQPVLTVFEDAHWIDPTSRELLDLTVDRVRNLAVLLIVTFRPEFQPLWSGQPHVTTLALNRLDRRDRTALVEQITGDQTLPDEVVAEIVERTDGVPLFIEELTKSVLESGVPVSGIPTTLHDSLMARLDRSASVRSVAQIGAAIGREFSYSLLRAVSRLPDDELTAAVGRLVDSELVFERGTPPDAVYSFKHALVQDAALGSLLRSARRPLHAQIAEALEAQSPELMESQPELFAQHYAEAGLVEKSIAYWGKAGHRSAARSAMAEAAAQLQKGLDQLALLPDTPDRQRQELELRGPLGAVLHTLKGGAAPEAGHAFARARELWEQLGFPSGFLHFLHGHSRYHAYGGRLNLALRLDEDLLRLSAQRNDSAGLVMGHFSSGQDLIFAGKFASSRSHLEQALALFEPISHRAPILHQIAFHPDVAAQSYLGIVLFCLGFPDLALARSDTAIAEARRLAHPWSLALALAGSTTLLSLTRDDAALKERADRLVAVAAEQRFALWHAHGIIHCGWGKVKNGDVAEGISLLRSGSTAFRSTGAKLWIPYHNLLLAKACEIAGQTEESAALLDEVLQIAEMREERWLDAELYRYKGQLLLRQGLPSAAEQLYWKALSTARDQEAKLWELRAAASLARLRRDQGRSIEARHLLAPVYSWFTEGFDTPDLKKTKTLLYALK